MIVMQTNVPKYRTSIREHRNGRCDDSNLLARINVSYPFTVRFTISFVSVGISFELPIIGCKEVDHLKRGSRFPAPVEQECGYEYTLFFLCRPT